MARFPWMKSIKKTQVEPEVEPPIWLRDTSNGEYYHPQTPREARIRKLILEKADATARKLGMERREFLASSMGMATSLWVINQVGCSSSDSGAQAATGAGGAGGSAGSDGGAGSGAGDAGIADASGDGCYDIPKEALHDEDAACAALGGNEFIFDIQTHHFDPQGEWVTQNAAYMAIIQSCGMPAKQDCVSADRYLDLMFFQSDTTMSALSTWPAALCTDTRKYACGLPLPNDKVVETRQMINMAANSQRIVNHCQLMPNDPDGVENQLAIMEEMHCKYGVAAWKLYPAWTPDNQHPGYFLDDPDYGLPFIEKGLSLGVNLFCVHKGLPIPGFDVDHNYPTEVGGVAKMYPTANFIIYHSGICAGQSGFCFANEKAYDATSSADKLGGTDTLIRSILDAGLAPNSNVYAEMGSAFSQVMNNPTSAAHWIGKLLLYVGENNICWGTDAILGGSPQSLIEAFRVLTIPAQMQADYGYPELTDAIKAKIFGLNAARVYGVDANAKRCQIDKSKITAQRIELDGELGARRWALTGPLGPRTRREFFELARLNRFLKVPG